MHKRGEGGPAGGSRHFANFPEGSHERGNKIRERLNKQRPEYKHWFNNNFWKHHHGYPKYYQHHHNPYYWWNWATVGSIGGWLGWNAAPSYYGYSDTGYYGNDLQINGSSQGYYQLQEGVEPIGRPSTYEATDGFWLALGVFALTDLNGDETTASIYMQLALSKDGQISGAYYNSFTDTTSDIQGRVDRASQRATWKIVGSDKAPTFETAVYNFARDEITVSVNYPDNSYQNMLLIHLQQ